MEGEGALRSTPPCGRRRQRRGWWRFAATEPQRSLRGTMSLGSYIRTKLELSRRGACNRGHIRGGLEGADGGCAEEIKVPAGPQTVTAVGLCPLPPSPEPRFSAVPRVGGGWAPRASSALPSWLLLASLSVSCSRPVSCVSESPSFPPPYLVCATPGLVCEALCVIVDCVNVAAALMS